MAELAGKRRNNHGKTDAAAIGATERAIAALELRKRGYPYRFIAEKLGYASASGSHKAVVTLLKRMQREAGQDLIDIEVERLDAMLVAVWARAKSGQVTAVDRVLKIIEARAKILGINAPTKLEHVVDTDVKSIAQLVREQFGEHAARSGADTDVSPGDKPTE